MSDGSSRRGALVWVLIAIALVAVVVLRPTPRRPYDLTSPEPNGYRGLALLLREFDAEVDTIDARDVDAATLDDYDVVFVPVADSVGAGQAANWMDYVEAGGRLVLGTPSEELGAVPLADDAGFPVLGGSFTGEMRDPGECDIAALAEGNPVNSPFFGRDLAVGAGQQSCYGDGNQALVIGEALGAGQLYALSSPDFLTNELMGAPGLDEKTVAPVPDNSVVAYDLLVRGASADAGVRVGVVTEGVAAAPVGGAKTLTDFMSSGVKLGLLQLFAAFAIYAAFRGRRHGKVVHEPAPVSLAGSSFVEAVGDLMERQGTHARAAEVLRDAQARELARRYGVPLASSRADLIALIAERTGRDPAELWALFGDPVDSESQLVALSRGLDSLRQEALHV